MTSTNAFNRFQSLVGRTTTDVVMISAVNNDGTSTANTLGGDTVIVKGDSVAVNGKAFVRNGEIIRSAPNLTVTQVSI